MPSAQDIASKLAHITGLLTAGGTNAQMKEWYEEYKKLRVELKQAKALQTKDPNVNEKLLLPLEPKKSTVNFLRVGNDQVMAALDSNKG